MLCQQMPVILDRYCYTVLLSYALINLYVYTFVTRMQYVDQRYTFFFFFFNVAPYELKVLVFSMVEVNCVKVGGHV